MSPRRVSFRTTFAGLLYAALVVVPLVLARATYAPAGHWCDHFKVRCLFAPGADPANAITQGIGGADKTIRVMAYSFTDGNIADALVKMKAKGTDVRVMLDDHRVKEPGSVVPQLLKAGIPVLTDAMHPIFHFKVVVIDGKRVLMGSYNFTHQAHRNGEALLDIDCDDVAKDFLAVWETHAKHAEPYPAGQP